MFYVFKKGEKANFIGGRYVTDIEAQIEELKEEIKSGNPTIYIDPNEMQVDSSELSPIETIKKKAIEEYLAQQAAATDKSNDMGNSEQSTKLTGMVTSSNVAATSAGSSSSNSPAPVSVSTKSK